MNQMDNEIPGWGILLLIFLIIGSILLFGEMIFDLDRLVMKRILLGSLLVGVIGVVYRWIKQNI